ncbi:MAG: HsdM family class I SAM-dependent methyltransferase, partial [Thermoplasmatota archaeon]
MSEVTENTVNAFFAEFLRARGLQISTEYSGKTSLGRNQPDFFLRNSGVIFGEGEWESSFMKGLKQAHDFINLPGATGSFVIAYPEKMREVLRRRMKDTTNPESLLQGFKFRGLLILKGQRAELFHGDAEGAATWLQDGILHRPRPENAGAFVSLMRDIVESLSNFLPTSGEHPTFFEHIIATHPKDAGELDTARRAAAYLLLNQVVFYRILSQEKYSPLSSDELERPGDLHSKFFERVLEDNYAAIFSSNVAALFPERSLSFIKDLITTVNAVQPESFTRDLLGSVFHELIPDKVRKSVAAYYTNPEAARLLAKLTIDDPAAQIADFACGSGTLLMAGYDRKAELKEGKLSEDDHRRFLEHEITGFDIMPFAAHLAVVQLALRQPSFLTDKVRIAVQDSTTLKPGQLVSPLQSSMPHGQSRLHLFAEENLQAHRVERGAISGQGKGHSFQLAKLDATLMNPPFTRKQLIGKDYRVLLGSRFTDYAEYESREQSLFGYFVFLADRFLKPGGRMGFVLPTTAIRQGSSEGIRKLLRDRYDVEYLISSGHRMAFSEDAAFSEVLLIARKRPPKAKARDNFVVATVRTKPTLDNMAALVSRLKDALFASGKGVESGLLSSPEVDVRIAETSELKASDWLPLLPGEEK